MGPVERVLDIARGEVGVTERPAGSNKVKYNTWFYGWETSGASYPWCCVFVCWVFHQAGLGGLLRKTGGSVCSEDNGGAVMRRSRGWSVILAAARPDYESNDGEEAEMSEKEIRELVAKEVREAAAETRYNKLEDVPDWARADIGTLAAMGVLKGNERGELDLSGDMVRVLALMARLAALGQEAGEKA